MNRPSFGEANLGALIGTVVGAVGGLFAVGLVPAILYRSAAALIAFPKLGLICWFISGVVAWLIGGQVGPRLGAKFHSQRAEVVGGVVSGLIPACLVALWSWYMVTGGR
jgi:hypothetical protein